MTELCALAAEQNLKYRENETYFRKQLAEEQQITSALHNEKKTYLSAAEDIQRHLARISLIRTVGKEIERALTDKEISEAIDEVCNWFAAHPGSGFDNSVSISSDFVS
jgi:hypothetical protein